MHTDCSVVAYFKDEVIKIAVCSTHIAREQGEQPGCRLTRLTLSGINIRVVFGFHCFILFTTNTAHQQR